MYTKTKPHEIQTLFDKIAKRYDLANYILSLGLHRRWNQKLVKAVLKYPSARGVDLCAGTGDISFRLIQKSPSLDLTLIDFSDQMLALAKNKAQKKGLLFAYCCADVTKIPFQEHCFDFATMAYGIRNIPSPQLAIEEAYRILKPKGVFAILELTRPSQKMLAQAHDFYLSKFLPVIGGFIAKDKEAYRYLASSIGSFVCRDELCTLLEKEGFNPLEVIQLNCGIASIILCQKKT